MADTRAILLVSTVVAVAGILGIGAIATPSAPGFDEPESPAAISNPADSGGDQQAATSDQPTLSVVTAEQPTQVRKDERFHLSATLAANAQPDASRTVELRIDRNGDGQLDHSLAERTVSVSEDGQIEAEFSAPLGGLDAGEYEYGVAVGEQSVALGSTTILQAPTFELQAVNSSGSVITGANATVTATVENVGDYAGERTVEVVLYDTATDSDRTGTTRTVPVSLDPGESRILSFEMSTAGLESRDHRYRVSAGSGSATGTLSILTPANFEVSNTQAANVTRGANAEVAATVANIGDIGGTGTVTLAGPNGTVKGTRSVALNGGANQSIAFDISTDGLARDTYNYTVSASANTSPDDASVDVHIREPRLQVGNLRGNETLTVGDPMVFAANVTNVGDAAGTASVELRIDLDHDGVDESDGVVENATLEPGEETTVQFRVPYMEDPDPLNQVEDLPTGTYTYGIYTAEDNETGAFDARSPSSDYGVSALESSTSEETVYWQVDFSVGESPPLPPSYWPRDLMAALGNSEDGVTQNPSLHRERNDSQLGAVDIVDKQFHFDTDGDRTSVTVRFEVDEGADSRELHLASFVLPGEFEESEIDQQELFAVTNATYEGGDTGELTVPIPH